MIRVAVNLTKRSERVRGRRGLALLDVMVGGIMLGIGLAVVMTVASRALNRQTDGEMRITAAWLADELLNMVLVEGPVKYPQLYDTSGRCDPPFDNFAFELDIKDQGLGMPFDVTATIRWPASRPINSIQVQTAIAARRGEAIEERAPLEPVDRDSRYFDDELDS